MTQSKISHVVMMGDSLSDRGTANEAYILGCIPMRYFAGLSGTSAKGRFTNGYVWADMIGAFFASDFMIKQVKKKYQYSNDDIADAIISKDRKIIDEIMYDYNLDNDLFIKFEGKDFIRSYDQGGLSSYDYAWTPSSSLIRFFSRIILPTLKGMRDKLFAYDKEHQLSSKHKSQSLVIEWSGANDLITVNAEPSIQEVDRAIKERTKNLELLIQSGYRNFIWFNLPDLSLTPRFQNMKGEKGEKARKNASDCVNYFNQELAKASEQLKVMYPFCSFDIFDINSTFVNAYQNPQDYGFDPKKLTQPYTTSDDFVILPNGTSPAQGYAFWDDIHPTADLHMILANMFYEQYKSKFNFIEPGTGDEEPHNITATQLKKAFCARYEVSLAKDRSSFFGSFTKARIDQHKASLEDILSYALHKNDKRTLQTLIDLQWIDQQGNIKLNIPELHNAMNHVTQHQNISIV